MGLDWEKTVPHPTGAPTATPRGGVMTGSCANWLRARLFRKPLLRMLLIGDSISVHYAPYLEDCLRGRCTLLNREGAAAALANLDVPLGANWGDSSMILGQLQATRLLDVCRADVALVNCGLHDIKRRTKEAECQVPLTRYRENLEQIADLFARTKTALIWVNTTPVDDDRHARLMKDFLRFDRDCREYNVAAEKVMRKWAVPTIDLYGFTKGLGFDTLTDHVHFTEIVRRQQGKFLADWLRAWRFREH